MKTYNLPLLKISIGILTLLTLIMILSSCNSSSSKETTSNEISTKEIMPQLFIRQGALSETEEWQQTIRVVGKINEKLESDTEDLKSRLQLAEIFINEARVTGEHGYYYPAILKIIDGVLAKESINDDIKFRSLSLKASVLLSLHQFENAKQIATQAVKLNQYNAQIYGALTDANVELGNYEEAVLNATKMMDIRPDLLSYSRASYLREIHGDPNGAIEAMKMAVASGFPGYENLAWARLTLGHLYENIGDLISAEKEYKTALEERPGYPFAIAALASIEHKKGNIKEAEGLLHKAIEIIPEVSFYESLAGIYLETGRIKEAKQTINETLAMMEDDELHGHIMNLEFAKVHLNLTHDYKAALARAKKEYEARPANIDVNKVMAEIYYKMNNMNESEKHLAIALRTNSQNSELLMIAGLINMKNGNQDQAATMIKRSIEINPYQSNQFNKEAKPILALKKN